ncbi:MAG: hypothetical protein ACQERO_15140 [Bacteroidota bacterium]
MVFRLVSALVVSLALLSCAEQPPDLGRAQVSDNYEEEIEQWYGNRTKFLKDPAGWMRLAGMHILGEGENTFGSGSDADIRFPEEPLPGKPGVLLCVIR